MAVSEANRRLIRAAERDVRRAETHLDRARAKLGVVLAETYANDGASYGELAKVLAEFGRPITRQRAFQLATGK